MSCALGRSSSVRVAPSTGRGTSLSRSSSLRNSIRTRKTVLSQQFDSREMIEEPLRRAESTPLKRSNSHSSPKRTAPSSRKQSAPSINYKPPGSAGGTPARTPGNNSPIVKHVALNNSHPAESDATALHCNVPFGVMNANSVSKSPYSDMPHEKGGLEGLLKRCREYFRSIDLNNDGRLDGDEFRQMIQAVGMDLDVAEMKKAWSRVDKDESGNITFHEFIASYAKEQQQQQQQQRQLPKPPSPPQKLTHQQQRQQWQNRASNPNNFADGCEYFWRNDTDCDGKLNIVEFTTMINELGMSLSRRDTIKAFKVANVDADGYLSFSEFNHAYLNKIRRKISTAQIRDVFGVWDKQCKGFLTKQEFRQVMRVLGNDSVEDYAMWDRLMKIAGREDNNKVTWRNFCGFLGLRE